MDSNELNPRTIATMAKSVSSAMRMMKSMGGDGPMSSKLSRVSKISRAEVKLIQEDKPMEGTLLFIAYTLLKSTAYLCGSYLYDRNPELVPFQMLIMRAAFAIITLIAYYNKELKKAVWDGVDRASSPPLIFRSIQGSLDDLIGFTATAVIPLTMISIVNNMSPLITVIMAYIILKERIQGFEILMIILTVAGIFEVVLTANSQDEDSGDQYS